MITQEIERKFLVEGNFKEHATYSYKIIQGYLSSKPERAVRVRRKGEKGYLTIKGIGNESGTSRFEWEKEIPINEVEELFKICEQGVINKKRYIIPIAKKLFFEVDEFYGDNQGLIVAEIELPTEETDFIKPDWLGKEVTGNIKYYNSHLSKHPFNTW